MLWENSLFIQESPTDKSPLEGSPGTMGGTIVHIFSCRGNRSTLRRHGRTCKLHTERPRTFFFLLWGRSVNHCATVHLMPALWVSMLVTVCNLYKLILIWNQSVMHISHWLEQCYIRQRTARTVRSATDIQSRLIVCQSAAVDKVWHHQCNMIT